MKPLSQQIEDDGYYIRLSDRLIFDVLAGEFLGHTGQGKYARWKKVWIQQTLTMPPKKEKKNEA